MNEKSVLNFLCDHGVPESKAESWIEESIRFALMKASLEYGIETEKIEEMGVA